MEAFIQVLSIVVAAIASTTAAIINSNARQAKTEQMLTDNITQLKKDYDDVKVRLSELSETDSCCVVLKDDVADIKDNLVTLSAAINQFKAESDMADKAMKETLKSLCRDRINQGHRYFMRRGEIDERSKESILAIGDCYLDILEGNTFVAEEIEDLKKLKVVSLV